MNELFPPARVAMLGSPNCGKSALFNLLTGSTQKIANYAGVTVERKVGALKDSRGMIEIIDLPGLYSLNPHSPDEAITVQVLKGELPGEREPERLLVVLDASHLERQLRLLAALVNVPKPILVALNMMDRAPAQVNAKKLSEVTSLEVIETIGVRADGADALKQRLRASCDAPLSPRQPLAADAESIYLNWMAALELSPQLAVTRSERIDRWVLHPVFGPLILALVLFLTFQAVFSWAQPFMHVISAGLGLVSDVITQGLPPGPVQSLLVNGILAGAGTVLLFLPQILLLFAFIIVLEDSGYLPRAAFLLDRLMSGVGLSGRAFIPLLSSFACAIPGILATRTIPDQRDRTITILIAPLMTCSARLPVYALLIGAFIPQKELMFGINLQGLVLFVLYTLGIVGAFAMAFVFSRFRRVKASQGLAMELPSYHWPVLRHVLLGLWQRTLIFINRVGGTILLLMVLVWFLSSFPLPPDGATRAPIEYSFVGQIGQWLLPIFKPIGFGWQIVVALIPGIAAREVVVGVLGTVYALGGSASDLSVSLAPMIAQSWSLPTALALLAWYVYAPQCLSTLVVVRRETNSLKMAWFLAAYQFVLAYAAALVTYRLAMAWWGAA